MRKYAGFVLLFVFLILAIPAFALLQKDIPEDKKSPSSSSIAPLSSEDYEKNNFYLVKNHKSGEVMKITPSDYIKGVVAAEMPISFHTEALKAQAVAAHTYALRQIDEQMRKPSSGLDGAYLSTDPAHFQAFLTKDEMEKNWGDNFLINYKKLSDAVDEVIHEAITYDDQPIMAAFHSISSGKTESAKNVWGQEVSYLSPVESEGDELSPNYETVVTLKASKVEEALKRHYPEIKLPANPEKWFTSATRSDSGTVLTVTAGTVILSGRELRELLSLKSANFQASCKGDTFTFVVHGYGHDVGMSQYGADYLARQGKSYQEILLHYYTGVKIEQIPSFENSKSS